jgi:hypothetical protein
MDYFKTVKEAFNIWWKNKYLWILGIIAVIFSGGDSSNIGNIFQNNSDSMDLGTKSTDLSPVVILILIVVACIALIISIIGIYLKSRADASLISSIPLIDKGKTLGFMDSWQLSNSKWLKLFLLNLLISVPIIIILIIVIALLVAIFLTSTVMQSDVILLTIAVVAIPSICIIALYSILARVIYTFASRISVLNNGGVWDSIKKSWVFIKSNLTHILMFWLINMAIGVGTGTVLGIVGLMLFAPMVLIIIPLFLINLWVGIIVGVLITFVLVALLSLLSGPIYSFGEIFWTKVYLTLKKDNA